MIGIMSLIVITFILGGVASYRDFFSGDSSLAKVGPERISQQDLDVAVRERLEQIRRQLGANFDERMFDTPAARNAALDGLLSERTLKLEAQRARIRVSDQQLQEAIGSIGSFQQDGHFDYNTYKTLLAAQGMSPASFEARVREDLARQTVIQAVADSATLPKSVAERLWQSQHEQREIRELEFHPQQYLDKVQIGEDAIRAQYDKNKQRYMTPETVRVEYLVLSPEDVARKVAVPEDQARAFYEQNMSRWGQPEKRRASHILIAVPHGASAADGEQARQLAESVLAKVRAHPADFPALARQYSKDPGSASKGGDLGWFGRGMMVKPFEDAVFSLKEGETSALVQTDFGFHIIRVTGIEPAKTKPFAEVKDQIESELRQQAAQKRFSETAEQFSNFVYEQADGLKAAADKFGLELRQADGVTRQAAPNEAASVLAPEVLQALFAPESLSRRRNIKAVEVRGGALVSARVLDHHAAAPIPLEAVRDAIRGELQRTAAADMARKAGQARLAELQKSAGSEGFGEARWVSRAQPEQLAPAALNAVMQAPAGRLPAYVGVEAPDGGFLVIQELSAKPAGQPAAEALAAADQPWMRQQSRSDEISFVQSLRQRYGAKIVKAAAPAKDSEE